MSNKTILAVETSYDETAVAVANKGHGLSKIEVSDYEPSTEIIKINFEEGICKEEGANNGMAA